jgi:tetratricopeptide (TPR) repeat protein
MSNLGLARLCEGHYESAASLFTDAATYVQSSKRLAQSNIAVVIYNNLAVAYVRLGRYVEAEAMAHKALEVAQAPVMQKKSQMLTVPPNGVLANIHLRFNEPESALQEYQKTLSICETSSLPKGFGKASFEQARLFCLLGLASAAIKLGKKEESRKYCDSALSVAELSPYAANPLALAPLNQLIEDYSENKEYAHAEKLAQLAYSIGSRHPFHPDAQQTLNLYERLLSLTDRPAEIPDMRLWLRHIEASGSSGQ